jgi:hypothetical protein
MKVKSLKSDVSDVALVEDVVQYFDFEDPWGNRLSFYQLMQ